MSSLRENFSVYFQDMDNYSFSLRENFTLSDMKYSEDKVNKSSKTQVDIEIENALLSAQCTDILEKILNDFDTEITRIFDKNGIELSGGQHQKLALARAFYRKHTALVLDEPSSKLDPKAENDVFESLKELTEGKMTIFTSHRLANVFLADRIIVLENGRVIESGTQKELLENSQRYAELFRYQQEKYMESEGKEC